MKKDMQYYLSLPYTVKIIPDIQDGGFVAMVEELPGCISQGETIQETLDMLMDAKSGWIEVALEDGLQIPEPVQQSSYSGSFVVRTKPEVHKQLVLYAKQSGQSLNQYVTTGLASLLREQTTRYTVSRDSRRKSEPTPTRTSDNKRRKK